MSKTGEILRKLKAPFPADQVHFRVGATTKDKTKGIALAYIDARNLMERLDSVVGAENWQCRYPFSGCCEIGIKIDGEWIWKANGAGVTDVEGEKGQYSDAFKRAGVLWGVGQYLYSLPNEWCELVPAGRSYKLKNPPKLPKWALPGYVPVMKKEFVEKIVNGIVSCIDNADEHGMKEILDELDTDEKAYIWRHFSSAQRGTIKEMLKGEGR